MTGEMIAGLFVITSWGLQITPNVYEQDIARMHQRPAVEVLARTIYGEARSEGVDGMLGVGWVILNRARHGGWYGEDIREVCLKPRQFSCWRADDGNLQHVLTVDLENHTYSIAFEIAQLLLAAPDESDDPTEGATYFHALHVWPKWAPTMEYAATIGRHRFYRPA